MHTICAGALFDAILKAGGGSVLDADFPAVIIGPLFADASEWTCAHSDCQQSV
jgi:non-ribosomal peptide synthetase component F